MATKTKAQPTNSYLTVKGGADAIAFYQKAFGAKVKQRMAAPDGKRVMHADLTVNGGTVMLSDEFPVNRRGTLTPDRRAILTPPVRESSRCSRLELRSVAEQRRACAAGSRQHADGGQDVAPIDTRGACSSRDSVDLPATGAHSLRHASSLPASTAITGSCRNSSWSMRSS